MNENQPAVPGSSFIVRRSSFAFCRRATRRAGSSFAAAFRLLPPARRQGMFALYAFMRATDDLANWGNSMYDSNTFKVTTPDVLKNTYIDSAYGMFLGEDADGHPESARHAGGADPPRQPVPIDSGMRPQDPQEVPGGLEAVGEEVL